MKHLMTLLALLGLLAVAGQADAASTKMGAPSIKIVRSGVTLTAQAIDYTNGNYVTLAGGEFLVLTSSALDVTMTATDQRTSLEGYTTNATAFCPAGGTRYVGPFVKSRWGDTNGRLQLTWTTSQAGVGVTCAVFRLPFGEPESQTK